MATKREHEAANLRALRYQVQVGRRPDPGWIDERPSTKSRVSKLEEQIDGLKQELAEARSAISTLLHYEIARIERPGRK